MGNIKINPKNNFNSEKYLKIFGESPIFFGLKMKLILIKRYKWIK